jgi:hypothetical protein
MSQQPVTTGSAELSLVVELLITSTGMRTEIVVTLALGM